MHDLLRVSPKVRSISLRILAGASLAVLATSVVTLARSGSSAPKEGTHAAASAEDMRADFAWFDQLGYPAFAERPLVRVAKGGWKKIGGREPEPVYQIGFLLADADDRFCYVGFDLWRTVVFKTGPDTPKLERTGFSSLSLEKVAQEELSPPNEEDGRQPRPHLLRCFLLGRACAAQRLDSLALKLYERARQAMETRSDASVAPPEFRNALAETLAEGAIWGAVLRAGASEHRKPEPMPIADSPGGTMVDDGAFTDRKCLREQFGFIVRNFPDSKHAASARHFVQVLDRMVAEDEAHVSLSTEELSRLPIKRQIAEWIYRLRDQHGEQWGQPGECDIFNDRYSTDSAQRGTTPAHRLVEIGYPAVPQLIAAIEDDSLTRSVGYWRDFVYSHHILTVGDCAKDILQRISGREFFRRGYTAAYMSKDGKAAETKKAAEAWWAEVQSKGARQVMIEGVGSGSADAAAQASQLVQQFPNDAADALIRGIRSSRDPRSTIPLLIEAAKLPGEEITTLLRETTKTAGFPLARAQAAACLLKRHGRDTVETRTLRDEAHQGFATAWDAWSLPAAGETGPDFDSFDLYFLLPILTRSGSAEVPNLLRAKWSQRTVESRMRAVDAAADVLRDRQLSQDLRLAYEAFLAAALEDLDADFESGKNDTFGEVALFHPRVADCAGDLLEKASPDRYRTEPARSIADLERARLARLESWRRSQGLPEQPRQTTPVSGHALSSDQAERIVDIVWTSTEAQSGKIGRWRERAEKFRKSPLSAEDLVALGLLPISDPVEGIVGISVQVARESAGQGLVLRLRPLTVKRTSQAVDTNSYVSRGKEILLHSFGSSSLDYVQDPEKWSDFIRAFKSAGANSPESCFQAVIELKN